MVGRIRPSSHLIAKLYCHYSLPQSSKIRTGSAVGSGALDQCYHGIDTDGMVGTVGVQNGTR